MSSKSKKKSKSSKIPDPIKIKKEDDHLIFPMEHYIDDRVELIRQIFSSLKPKTITNLAPDFLKKSKLEDIQEQCLNEILGISKKRLLSVINSTKCPTDTSSSEEEIHSVTEHISLEEISSDSDIADSKTSKVVGRKKQKVKTQNDKNQQFSVLELLELQARARAIRSQLALEPVTKIEVDTDSDEDGPPKQKPPSALAASRQKEHKSANGRLTTSKSSSDKKPDSPTLTVIKPNNEVAPSKRVKLKRNFRKQVRDDEDSNEGTKSTENNRKETELVVPKKEKRSPSPDVIPIVSVPETLCITDSEDDKMEGKETTKGVAPSKISQQLEIISVVNIGAPITPSNDTPSTDKNESSSLPQKATPVESEEEGEILDEEEEKPKALEIGTDDSLSRPGNNDGDKSNQPVAAKASDTSSPVDSASEVEVKEKTASVEERKIKDVPAQKPQSVDSSNSEDDDNDDVISLEGGDLVDEMKEHMRDEVEDITPQEDIICLDDSSEEEAKTKKKTESWNDRWLNSRRVSKVLAESRLGNRVRNKIKETRKAKRLQEAQEAIEKEQEKPKEVIFHSKHELGSVEQYKEILESIPRKSTD